MYINNWQEKLISLRDCFSCREAADRLNKQKSITNY